MQFPTQGYGRKALTLLSQSGAVTADLAGGVNYVELWPVGAVTGFGFSNPELYAHTVILVITQDATGGRSVTFNTTQLKLPGGSYTPTATANGRDVLTFVRSGVLWIENARSINVS